MMNLDKIRAGRLLRRFLGQKYELFILWLFIGGVASVPIAAIIFAVAINGGYKNLTFPSPRLHFVPGPKGRGTLNLISVCMSTIFTCVYVSVHGDVPDASKAEAFARTLTSYSVPSFIVTFIKKVYTFIENPTCKRILFMLFNVIAPELVVLVAALELSSAYDGLRFMRKCKQRKWSMTLAFFADMGGFELDDENHSHFQNGREFLEWFEGCWRSYHGDLELDVERIKIEIDDRSKANIVLKLATLLQAGWLFVVTLVRFANKIPVSELEVTTCAYIFCTAFTYLFWLSKPYNVGTRVVLRESLFLPRSLSPKEQKAKSKQAKGNSTPSTITSEAARNAHDDEEKGVDAIVQDSNSPVLTTSPIRPRLSPQDSSSSHFRFSTFSTYSIQTLSHSKDVTDGGPGENEKQVVLEPSIKLPIMIYPNARFTPFNRSYLHPEISWLLACILTGAVGGLVGVIHAAPLWKTPFIDSTVLWMWRASCIVQVTMPVLIAFVSFVEWIYTGGPLFFAALFMALVYGIARLILFALIWLSFWSLPAGVYTDVDWTWSEFPHWH
ncbi:hypothetical protein PHLGIDRAFT_383849 [Phlebiopsis gigantea 11061_1 CR5-6]|uniref:Uncharacterized protein n=1 Tax=Phlebiopsis gigantea (strain 11061_1 CR5-6) TaxID=745531 RepID=A0A0C3NT13_PHLG1|nr:hypothetical protein PHLGIDRAFT_383849 [Phlebiopsis gigantea 11061_1 CR5-6]